MPEITWNTELVEQVDWHWRTFVRPRIDDLDDAEYLWQPTPDCWTVGPRGAARSPNPAGAGDVVMDYEWPQPRPAPLTTIGWRLSHIYEFLRQRATNHFGAGDHDIDAIGFAATAAGGIALVDEWYRTWFDGVRALGEKGLERPCGPAEGPFAEAPFAALVLHINREILHHAAEVLTLRDLYRASGGGTRFSAGGPAASA
jgi:hypothetical protein